MGPLIFMVAYGDQICLQCGPVTKKELPTSGMKTGLNLVCFFISEEEKRGKKSKSYPTFLLTPTKKKDDDDESIKLSFTKSFLTPFFTANI